MDDKQISMKRAVRNFQSVPVLSGVITKLTSLAEDDKATIQEMARLVSSDQVLCAKILKLVNSPFYGFSRRVSTISHALILLGVNVVKSLAISSSIFEVMEKNIVGLWEHSLGTGVIAGIIARRLDFQESEEIATAALLHDIGKVIIRLELKEEYNDLLSLSESKEVFIREAEREMLGVDHAEIGELLARRWFLPDKLIEPIACHHDVEKSVTYQTRTAIVHIADVFSKAGGFGFSGDDFVPQIQPIAWKRLGLNEHMLEELIDEIEDALVETKNFSLELLSDDNPKA